MEGSPKAGCRGDGGGERLRFISQRRRFTDPTAIRCSSRRFPMDGSASRRQTGAAAGGKTIARVNVYRHAASTPLFPNV